MSPGTVVFWRVGDVIRFGYVKEHVVKYTENDTIETYTVVDGRGVEFHPTKNECHEYYYDTEYMINEIKTQLALQYGPKLENTPKANEVPF